MPDQSQRHDVKEKEMRRKKEDDSLGTLVWAAILIWAGAVLLANNLGYLDVWATQLGVPDLSVWNFLFLGAALLLVGEIVLRLTLPAYRRPVLGKAIFALISLGIGLGDRFGWELIWPAILILAGLSILLRGVIRPR